MADTTLEVMPDCDVAIIGGGILGLATAALTAQRGYRVHLYRLGNAGLPRADSLRNQGWLQSGLMYVGKIAQTRNGKPIAEAERKAAHKRGRILADRMYNAGLALLDGLGIPRPQEEHRGILRVREGEEDERTFLADAKDLGVEDVVQKLPLKTAKRRLGPLFEEGTYYVIPDAPFPVGKVLEVLRSRAAEGGVVFVECRAPVWLEQSDRSPAGHAIASGSWQHTSRATVVGAGAGSYSLLTKFGIDPHITLQQTPLLVVDGCHKIETTIFADRPRKFSIVRHPPSGDALPEGALVIGTAVVEKDVPFVPYDERKICDRCIQEFKGLLPDCLMRHVKTGRFTAGYEVVPYGVTDDEGFDLHYVEPRVDWVGTDKGMALLVAMPGRATMGLYTAELVVKELEKRIGPPSERTANAVTGGWTDEIHMHFHRHYSFDDRE